MIDRSDRRLIMNAFGKAVDTLVRDLYSDIANGPSTVQEPEITARICQRLEDRLNGRRVGSYNMAVTAQSMPDRGRRSIERVTGADLLLSISLDGPDAFNKTLFIQAKYDRNVNRNDLLEACKRMERALGIDGAYIWVYEPGGVKVFSPFQVSEMQGNSFDGLQHRSVTGLTGRILDCYAGSQKWGIPMGPNRRKIIQARLRELRMQESLDLQLKKR